MKESGFLPCVLIENEKELNIFLELADFGLAIEVHSEQTQWYGML